MVTLAVDAIGWLVARRLSSGDEQSDDFRIAAICWGKQLASRAPRLRSGSAIAVMGGLELDLRDASPNPGGASLDVYAVMGGVQITVPPEWAVQVEKSTVAGGVDLHLPRSEELSEDAPTLQVNAFACMGGSRSSAAGATEASRPTGRARGMLSGCRGSQVLTGPPPWAGARCWSVCWCSSLKRFC